MLTVAVVSLLRLPVGHLQGGQFFAVPERPVEVFANLLLVQGLANVESIEAPLWSLPLEMEMYLVLPLLFTFVRDRRTAHRAIALWAAACVLGLVCERYKIGEMPAYVPCFLAGVVSYRAAKPKVARAFWLWPLALAAITLLYVRKPLLEAGWVCCLALGLILPQLAELPRGIAARTCHAIARYSYGIYLWHFILIWFAFVRLETLPLGAKAGVFVALLVGVPVLLYHCVEAPMIRVGGMLANRLKTRSSRVLWTSAAVGAAAFAALVGGLRVAAARRPFVLGLTPMENDSPCVHLVGRFDTRDGAGPKFAWPGSALEVSFGGTGIDILLRAWGSNFFAVVVDNGHPHLLSTIDGTHEYALASDLHHGTHRVVLTKRTEAFVGAVQYLGVMPRGGTLVRSAPLNPTRRIEFIGDSIACGYGILGADATCPFSPETEDESLGFAALAATAVGAEARVIAYSGKGMYRDCRGRTADQMPVLFRRTLPDDPTSTWEFADGEPSVVVVELGTNDYSLGDPGSAFERAYATFLRDLRRYYPTAPVICTLGPMLSDSNRDGVRRRSAATAAILEAVDERRVAGDARVSFLAVDEEPARAGRGCDDHPDAEAHRVFAATLADTLRRVVDW
jgi:lysophospholipase L1-like esterase